MLKRVVIFGYTVNIIIKKVKDWFNTISLLFKPKRCSLANLNEIKNKLKENSNVNTNVTDGKIIFNYELTDLELKKEDLEFLLSLIINSKIDGSKLYDVFNLSLKLQYKIKIIEDKNNGME